LAKELGASPGTARTPFLGMLGMTVAAARAYGLAILDGVYNALDDTAGLEEQCRQAVEFGFDGKTLIHPGQIEICNAVFSPDAEAVAWAERIIAAFDTPENANKGAIRVDGKMVERLHLAQAHRTLSMATGFQGPDSA
jgi:citrate lyase subunit beta/citryl-CoA lyase